MAETFDPHCVWFVGAGPGDRELITLKGYRLLQQAQVVIYAGSLINTELLAYCPPQAECHDSAALHLEQILDLMEAGVKAGKTVVRLQTGDVSLYGSVREQGEELTRRGIRWQVVPGVSAFLGAAAELGVEYTVPEVSQSLIITRLEGRTPVPAREQLEAFASHFGADFYGLPRNRGSVTLTREPWQVPERVQLADGQVLVPYWAGQTLNWRLVAGKYPALTGRLIGFANRVGLVLVAPVGVLNHAW